MKEATQMSTNNKYAIKIMDKTKFTSSQLDLIKTEVKLMNLVKGHRNGNTITISSQLNSLSVVALYDVYESNYTLWLVLELYAS